jgi:hypothetical protein
MGLWDAFKEAVGTVYGGAKNIVGALTATASKWLEGEYHAPDFVGGGVYSYCGPGTKLRGQAPINAVDAACRRHDEEYESLGRQKSSLPTGQFNEMVRQSDKRLVESIDRSGHRDFGSLASKWGIKGKMALEDWGILNPGRFVG